MVCRAGSRFRAAVRLAARRTAQVYPTPLIPAKASGSGFIASRQAVRGRTRPPARPHRRSPRRCRAALRDGNQRTLSISEIAYRWRFNDLPHFNKAFRARFDTTPREWRNQIESN
jgi:AraC-like DNA-binding protein